MTRRWTIEELIAIEKRRQSAKNDPNGKALLALSRSRWDGFYCDFTDIALTNIAAIARTLANERYWDEGEPKQRVARL